MKLLNVIAVIVAALVSSPAHARKDCAELKSEIAHRIEAKGVKAYSLEMVAATATTTATVVGSCNGGTQKIVYTRFAAAPERVASDSP